MFDTQNLTLTTLRFKIVDFLKLVVSNNSSANNKKSSNKPTANIKSVEVLVAKGYFIFSSKATLQVLGKCWFVALSFIGRHLGNGHWTVNYTELDL